MRTIAVVTTSRADYGHLYWVLRELSEDPECDPRLIVTGAHLSPEFGETAAQIEADGFVIEERLECLLSSDTDVGMAKTIGLAALSLADALGRLRPDLLLLIADRYEMLAPASAALALRIPVAHIEGGEISEGAIDQSVRDALTKMSHIHLVPTASAAARVARMGEEEWRIHRVGAPSLDHLRRSSLPGRAELESRLGIDLGVPPAVVAIHPVTIARNTVREADAVFEALDAVPGPLAFCFPNADAGSRRLVERARELCARRSSAELFVNLEPLVYWGLLRQAAALVGNSSSGIMEAASVELPVVNVGIRQQGRERAANVIDVEADGEAIVEAVAQAVSEEFRRSLEGIVNPYGDGRAAERIVRILSEVELGERLLRKRVADRDAGGPDDGGPGGRGAVGGEPEPGSPDG